MLILGNSRDRTLSGWWCAIDQNRKAMPGLTRDLRNCGNKRNRCGARTSFEGSKPHSNTEPGPRVTLLCKETGTLILLTAPRPRPPRNASLGHTESSARRTSRHSINLEAGFCLFWPRSHTHASQSRDHRPRGCWRLKVPRDAALEDFARRARLPPLPGPAPLASAPGAAADPAQEEGDSSAWRHKARPERLGFRRDSVVPGQPDLKSALTGSETPDARSPHPRGPLRALTWTQRRGGPGAAKRPGSAGSRRKNARARGGGEVIKGKKPAAGGSGRFGCSGSCCLVFGPLEGRYLEGRRCRPQ